MTNGPFRFCGKGFLFACTQSCAAKNGGTRKKECANWRNVRLFT